MGSKAKFWYLDLGRPVLFKAAREETGEDWAEKVAQEASHLLSLPSALYELAESDGTRGVVSPTFLEEGQSLIHGNELLSGLDASYAAGTIRDHGRTSHYSVDLALTAIERSGARLKRNWLLPRDVTTAADVFAGILMLDAVVGNTDRHQENWAIIESTGQDGTERVLAPQFDCASCLGRNESDDRKSKRLLGADKRFTVQAYADKAMSPFYSGTALVTQLTPLQAFLVAAKLRPGAAAAWVDRLRRTPDQALQLAVDRVPVSRISDTSRVFAKQLLSYNRNTVIQVAGAVL